MYDVHASMGQANLAALVTNMVISIARLKRRYHLCFFLQSGLLAFFMLTAMPSTTSTSIKYYSLPKLQVALLPVNLWRGSVQASHCQPFRFSGGCFRVWGSGQRGSEFRTHVGQVVFVINVHAFHIVVPVLVGSMFQLLGSCSFRHKVRKRLMYACLTAVPVKPLNSKDAAVTLKLWVLTPETLQT